MVLFEGDEEPKRFFGVALDALERAWAITIHKCQGSEYADVVIPIFSEHLSMWERMPGLLYTAVSRGRKRVRVIASRESFRKACMAGVRRHEVVRSTAWYLKETDLLDRVVEGENLVKALSTLSNGEIKMNLRRVTG